MDSSSGQKGKSLEGEVAVKHSRPAISDDDLFNITDTEAAITAVVRSQTCHQLCRGALIHQLYAILSNKTFVDTEILALRLKGSIKLLQFDLSGTVAVTESHFVMLCEDYKSDLHDSLNATSTSDSIHGSFRRFIPLALKYLDKMSILESDLLAPNQMNGVRGVLSSTSKKAVSRDDSLSLEDIREMIAAGYLSRRTGNLSTSDNVLWFSHPTLGNVRQWIHSGRKEITVSTDLNEPSIIRDIGVGIAAT
jgi:hypothetical protein